MKRRMMSFVEEMLNKNILIKSQKQKKVWNKKWPHDEFQ